MLSDTAVEQQRLTPEGNKNHKILMSGVGSTQHIQGQQKETEAGAGCKTGRAYPSHCSSSHPQVIPSSAPYILRHLPISAQKHRYHERGVSLPGPLCLPGQAGSHSPHSLCARTAGDPKKGRKIALEGSWLHAPGSGHV